jgi:integrase
VRAGTEREAQKELRAILRQIDTDRYIEPSKQTLADYLEQWLKDMEANVEAGTLKPKTVRTYAGLIRTQIVPHLDRVVLEKLTARQIQSFYTHLLTEGRKDASGGLSPQSVKHIHRVLSEALRQAARLKVIPANPCSDLDPQRDVPRVRRKAPQVLNEEQTRRLLRLDEGVLMAEQALVYVKRKLQFGPTKTGETRPVDLPMFVAAALRQHKKVQAEHRLERHRQGLPYENHDLVTAREDGRPVHPDMVTSGFRAFLQQHGLPRVRFHALRHGHATHLRNGGADLEVVSERLGHAGIAITADTYTHRDRESQRKAARLVDTIYTGDTELATGTD